MLEAKIMLEHMSDAQLRRAIAEAEQDAIDARAAGSGMGRLRARDAIHLSEALRRRRGLIQPSGR